MIAVDNTLINEVVKIFIKKDSIVYNRKIQQLLKYISPPIIIGRFQINDLRALSQSQGLVRFTNVNNELDLAKKSKLKLILSNNQSNYPYININSDEFESNYTATYRRNNNKQKVLEHLNSLIKAGDRVEIYDKYLFCDNGDIINIDNNHHSVNIISQLVSTQNINFIIKCIQQKYNRRNINIINEENQRISQRLSNFNQNNISFNNRNLNEHDRYIRVFKNRNKLYEIIFSSGLYNILGNSDFTYVVRVF